MCAKLGEGIRSLGDSVFQLGSFGGICRFKTFIGNTGGQNTLSEEDAFHFFLAGCFF